MRRVVLLLLLLLPSLTSCEWLHSMSQSDKDKARALLEACLRESWTQGEAIGRFGIACAALNQWTRDQGWHAQP
jgi:hypothetical protein